MISRNPDITAGQIETVLEGTADKIGGNNGNTAYSSGFNQFYGYGKVNATAAVNAAWSLFVPSTPDLKFTSDWGFSETDNKTFDTTPTFEGTAPAGSHVWLYVNGTAVADVQLGTGVTTYSLEPTSPLTTGNKSVTIKVAENGSIAEANRSAASSAIAVEIANTDSSNLGSTFAARMSETLVTSGANTGSSTLAINWGVTPPTLTKTGSGVVEINTVTVTNVAVKYVNNAGETEFDVNTGSASAANWSVEVNETSGQPASKVEFHTTHHLSSLVVNDDALAVVVNGGSDRVLVVTTLDINGDGQLDMTDNDMIIKTTSGNKNAVYTDVFGWIGTGHGTYDANFIWEWNGAGIISSAARSFNVSAGFDMHALGVIRNSDLDVTTGVPGSWMSSFAGETVGEHNILLKYTYTGDGNFDGAVTFDDYAAFDAYDDGLIPYLGWATGDITVDGALTFDDWAVIDQTFFNQGGPLSLGIEPLAEPRAKRRMRVMN
jgi:hypothetical protein